MEELDIRVRIILDAFRVSNLLGRLGSRMAGQVGLTSIQQWWILGDISRNEGIALKDLCHSTLVTKQNITGMIDRLRQSGYVTTYSDPVDKRVTRVRLTDKGRQVLEIIRPISRTSNEQTFNEFTESEMEQLASLLEKLVETLRNQVEKSKKKEK